MMGNDQKGQISVELILLLGIIFVIVIVIATQVGLQTESNKISVSAKEGAIQALANEAIINRNFVPTTVRTISMTGSPNVLVLMNLSQPLSSSEYEYVLNNTFSYIQAQGFVRRGGASNTTSKDDYIETAEKNYFIQFVW